MKFNIINLSFRETKLIFVSFLSLDLFFAAVYFLIHILGREISTSPLSPLLYLDGLFNLDSEFSLPAWYSSTKLFLIGLIFFLSSLSQVNQNKSYLSSKLLLGMSCFFIFLSADEGAGLHERFNAGVRELNLDRLLIGGHGAHVFLYSLLALPILFFAYQNFQVIWRYFRGIMLLLILGIVVFVIGSVVFDDIISHLFMLSDSTSKLFKVEVLIEESLEMLGSSIILYGTLLLIRPKKKRG